LKRKFKFYLFFKKNTSCETCPKKKKYSHLFYYSKNPAQKHAISQLQALTELINQTVGDAISDMLLVEAILTNRQWSLEEWDQAYTDLPNRLVKVVVADRHIFKTTNAERQLVEPVGLQAEIDSLVAKYSNGRSFVR
jgi:phosphoacetylglucosamine mutase